MAGFSAQPVARQVGPAGFAPRRRSRPSVGPFFVPHNSVPRRVAMMTDRSRRRAIVRGVRGLPTLQRRADLMGMAVPVYYTADMVRALPDDGQRYETVHGELLVTPSPRELHQRVLGRIFLELGMYLREQKA